MKKVMKFLGVLFFASILLTSCGDSEEKLVLKVDKVSINGDSKEYIEVVPGEYELKKVKDELGEDQLQISIKFRVKNEFDQSKMDENTDLGNLSLRITDSNGSPINLEFDPADISDYDKLTSLLKSKKGDEVTVLFKPMAFGDEALIKEVLKNGKGIEITSADITNLKSESNIDNSISSDETESTSGDCEQFCADYEEFANEYVAFMKKYKSNPSDMSILAEYSEMVQRASEMQESSADCSADLTVAARITKALSKIAKAAM
jgi:hypothetical protein